MSRVVAGTDIAGEVVEAGTGVDGGMLRGAALPNGEGTRGEYLPRCVPEGRIGVLLGNFMFGRGESFGDS